MADCALGKKIKISFIAPFQLLHKETKSKTLRSFLPVHRKDSLLKAKYNALKVNISFTAKIQTGVEYMFILEGHLL